MIVPLTLAQMIAATRLDDTQAAIVASLGALLKGVKVVPHPGKLDINDVVEKAIVTAPGVAIGYTRVRELGDVGGTFSAAVDFAAYIVVEDWVDKGQTPPRTVSRAIVGPAIGQQLLRILREPDTACWGLGAIEPPSQETPPALTPVFTMKSAEQTTALYAVTWTQSLVQDGEPFFGFGGTPAVDQAGVPAGPQPEGGDLQSFVDELDFDVGDGPLPPELLAYIDRGGTP